jgi:hypothetical protein
MTASSAFAARREGRRGSQRRLGDGGCYLGIPLTVVLSLDAGALIITVGARSVSKKSGAVQHKLQRPANEEQVRETHAHHRHPLRRT